MGRRQQGMRRTLCSGPQPQSKMVWWSLYVLNSLLLLANGCWNYHTEMSIALLRYGTQDMKAKAAAHLSFLSDTKDSRAHITEAGGIEPLKAVLRDGTMMRKARAAIALLMFSYEREADAGVVEAVVALLRDGTPKVSVPTNTLLLPLSTPTTPTPLLTSSPYPY
jgi:hypothetical protein